jgi:hypothetical protein
MAGEGWEVRAREERRGVMVESGDYIEWEKDKRMLI